MSSTKDVLKENLKQDLKKERLRLEKEYDRKLTKSEYNKMYRIIKLRYEPKYYDQYMLNKYSNNLEHNRAYFKKWQNDNREEFNKYHREYYNNVIKPKKEGISVN